MAISAATAATIAVASTALSTGIGVASAIAQSQAQQRQLDAQSEQASYQAQIERRNRQLAEEEASARRREGYENMAAKRQETAKLIGRQRAALGASGAVVDEGSALDLVADSAEQGEIDAINIFNRGIDSSYQSQIQAWNHGNQASAQDAASDMYASASGAAPGMGLLNAAGVAAGGIASMGSTWGSYLSQTTTTNWDQAGPGYLKMRHPSGKWATVRT